MIISHGHKFIFIHVWKTGGTSVAQALAPFVENETQEAKYLKSLFQKGKPRSKDFDQHITAVELQEKLERRYFDNYFKFAFVRNPLSWEVSYYHFITQYPNNHPERETIIQLQSFDKYIVWAAENDMPKRSQRSFIQDVNGKQLVDFVGRHENLDEDLQYVASKLGLPDLQLERANSSKHDPYQEYYTAETEGIVREVLKDDFELFGYE